MLMHLKNRLNHVLRKFGYDLSRYGPMVHPVARKKRLFEYLNNDVVLDVGAGKGQFADSIRDELNYKNKIISFEPLSEPFGLLYKKSSNDKLWDAFNFALGNSEEELSINVAKNIYSSSFLEMLPTHLKVAPYAEYVRTEIVKVKTLDAIFSSICDETQSIYLKIDAQGFEHNILEGAEGSLKYIQTIQIEMSLEQLYEDEVLIYDAIPIMDNRGYKLISIEPGLSDWKTGKLIQVDGIFQRYK